MVPFFSIIIPTYNRASMLPIAIDSVINQTFILWELIIVDDGSTDNTKALVENYKDNRIRYIYQHNQERSAARNNGIEISAGRYICFLDSDDYYMPDRLQLLYLKLIELSEPIAFIFTGLSIDNNGIITVPIHYDLFQLPNKYDFFMRSHIHCQQTCISREILLKNKFNTDFKIGEDTELWFRIISRFNFIYLKDQNTVVITDHDDRSINVSLNNVYYDVLKLFNYVRKEFKYPFSKDTIQYINRDCYFGIAKYYIYQKQRFNALINLLLSLIYDIRYRQFRYRLNIALNIIFNFNKALQLIGNNQQN